MLTDDGLDVIVVRGPAGSGKTKLLRDVQRCVGGDTTVHFVTASPSSETPFSAFASLLTGTDLADLTPAAFIATIIGDRSHGGSPASAARHVVMIDDVAHLDDASAAMIHQVGLGGELTLVFSLRDGHRLPPALTAFLASTAHRNIVVAPLVTDEVASLAADLLGAPLDDTSLHVLTEASRGNPLYIRELLTGANDAGVVAEHNGVWHFTGRLTLSPLLEELIVARLGPLTDDERRLVELVAVGGPLELDVVRHASDLAVVEGLENRNIVVVTTDDRVDLIHPLYGEVVLAGVGRLTRQRRFAELAVAELEARNADRGTPLSALRSVVWHVRGGLDPGPEALLAAARLAKAAFDPWLAAELAGLAFEQGRRGDAALVAADGLAATGRHDAAGALLREAIDATDDPWIATACRLRLAEELWWWGHDLDGARALLTEGDTGITDVTSGDAGQDAPVDILTAQLGVFAILDGDITTASALCAPLVAHPSLLVRFVAAIGQTHALAANDRADEALALAQRTYDECMATDEELLGDPNIHIVNQIMALLYVGRLDDARFYGDLINDAAAQQRALVSKAWGSLMSGFALVLSGEPERARTRLAQAEAYWREAGVPGIQRWALAGRVLAEAALGVPPAPKVVIDAFGELRPDGFGLYGYLADLAITWAAVAHDDERLAHRHGEAAIASVTAPVHRAHVAHDLARLGLVDLVRPLDRPAEVGPFTIARWDFVDGVVAGDPELLERSAETFAACGAHLFAAEAFTLAARIHKRAGRRRDTARVEGRGAQERLRCGAVDTPALRVRHRPRGGGTGGGPLSARELQIARLAAQGLTNRAIAERLIIGERTVETHLSHVYVKLGLAGRGELPTADLT